ncbi:MAG: bifunctional nuclease family protein [Gemmatimonadaceae bacterium]
MVEVVVARLGIDSSSQSYVLILQEKGGERLLPIWIGQPEAESIVMQMQNIRRPRPLTHDLCKTLIAGLGGSLRHVHITRVEKNTYYAELQIHRGETVVQIDARPSDSIAIALRLSAPILVEEALLSSPSDESAAGGAEGEGAGEGVGETKTDALTSRSADDLSAEQLKAYLENLRPEDFGKFNL